MSEVKENIVYHGSRNGNIDFLKAHVSTHGKECIYATENKTVAMLFMGEGKGDLDTVLAVDDDKLILVERRAGVLEDNYNHEGYVYELPGDTFRHYDYLWKPEMISFEKSIRPIRKTYYDNVLEALENEEREGHLKIYHYPSRPSSIPFDNSDLIDKYIMFYNNGNSHAIDSLLECYPEFSEEVKSRVNGVYDGERRVK